MARWFCIGLIVLVSALAPAQAQETDEEPAADAAETADIDTVETLTLQLKWSPQTQFAGYYLAQDQGYYAAEGLTVTILPGGPEIDPNDVIRNGQADIIVQWLPAALVARQQGLNLVNIAQIFQFSGQTLACRKDAGIETEEDLRGKRLAVAMAGNQYAILAWLDLLGIPTDGSAQGVTVIDQGEGVGDLNDGTADCVSAQTYNELELLTRIGFNEGNLTVFYLQGLGAATLQDGLYVTEQSLGDPAMVDKLARFIRASLRGWRIAIAKPESATDIVMRQMTAPDASRDHQSAMLDEVRKLVGPTDDFLGLLVPEDYDASVAILIDAGIVPGAPPAGWTHSVWLQAQ